MDLEKDNESVSGGYTLRLIADGVSNCKIWIHADPLKVIEHSHWSGECQNGLATGEGNAVVKFTGPNPDMAFYSGGFNEGLMNGYGELKVDAHSVRGSIYLNSYKGLWLDGHRHGEGEENYHSTTPAGDTYSQKWTGHFEQNELWGKGQYVVIRERANGFKKTTTKHGDWQNHFLHGHGTEIIETISNDGERSTIEYIGDWANGIKTGFGKEKTVGIEMFNFQYEGSFRYNFPEGTGKVIYSNGDSFEGEWSNGFPLKGRCEFQSIGYSGACKRYEYKTSKYSGLNCLGTKKGMDNCLPAFRRMWRR